MPLEKSRNSPVRSFLQKPVDKLASSLVKRFPDLTADHITYAGTTLVALGASLRAVSEGLGQDYSWFSLGLIGLGVAFDGLDGAVARQKNPDDKSSHGVIVDVLNDRAQETVLALSRIATASLRGDPFGVLAATFAGITNPLPSLTRAMAEKNGVIVAESGKNPLSFLGTRLGRVGLAVSATVYPQTNIPFVNEPMQPFLDALTTFANISSTIERIFIWLKNRGSNQSLDETSKMIAAEKAKALTTFTLINTVVLIPAGIIGICGSLNK
jgi:phosphatidylglycerophosphate synthase